MLWSLIVGAIIGAIAGSITKKSVSMNLLTKTIAGLLGSVIGQSLLGERGPHLAGMAIIPSIIGAIILILGVSYFRRDR
ncbi:GlsB/YeaQ/YmgE family stress response membrane protein [Vagococcus zengguangii]|uniref:GlsB/YeaQ/YmgE family stress response membrane protein n=1 Tax=Vagococcus zengguangii TaxID=2571750 RepID=A0A4D7CSW2_9ENTE|nr:GlsB/YeaQ/YmgE family stress response membrane protein [Vagococcus zengguangii]QCI86233.1 GlsB/YeaQ/YmgE family stress response membrane protein [Vagococcus zengguangii]